MKRLLPLLDRLRSLTFSVLRVRTMGAMVLAVDEDDQVLLIRQAYGPPAWTLPGGGAHRHESLKAAALREGCEEVGLHLRGDADIRLLGLYFKRRGGWADHVAVYVVRGWELKPSSSREITAIERFSLNALPAEVAPSVRHRIAEYRGERPVGDAW